MSHRPEARTLSNRPRRVRSRSWIMAFGGSVLVCLVIASSATSNVSYESVVMADSPSGYWRLDEASGTVASDATASARHGTYTGSPVLGVSGALADEESSGVKVDLAGGWDGLVVDPFPSTENPTIEAWIRIDGLSNELSPTILSHVTNGRAGSWYIQVDTLTGRLRVVHYASDYSSSASPDVADGPTRRIDDGDWHHIVVELSGPVMYVDGESGWEQLQWAEEPPQCPSCPSHMAVA